MSADDTSRPSALPDEKSDLDQPHFLQRLGLFDSTMLVAGAMIGSGIFLVSAEIARDVGSAGWLLLVWVLAGVITIFGALSYAELAAMMPHAGGQYVYLRESIGPVWGFLYGWTLFLVIQTGTIAAVAVTFGKFIGIFFPALSADNVLYSFTYELPWLEGVKEYKVSAAHLVGVAMTLLLTAINCQGIQVGKVVQNIFTVFKTFALIVLIVVGLTLAASSDAIKANFTDPWTPDHVTEGYTNFSKTVFFEKFLSGAPALAVTLMLVGGAMVGALFAADAWNNVTFTAGEVKNPRRNLPLSLALGTGMVILLYLLANVAYLVDLPVQGDPNATTTFGLGIDHARQDRVGTAVFELISRYGVYIMAVAIVVSTFGCANGLILMGARLYYAMARDGLFFQSAGKLNSKGVPAIGLVLQGIWACLLIFSGTYNQLLDYVIFAALLFYVLTVTGLFVLRRTRPDAERPYKAFGYPVVPALYLVLCAVIMLDLLIVKPLYTWPGLLIVLTGMPVYVLWRHRMRSESV